MTKVSKSLYLFLSLLLANRLTASEPIAPFLKTLGSTRQTALGGAYAAADSELDVVTANPAGILGQNAFQAYFTYFPFYENMEFTHGYVSYPIADGVWGLGFTRLGLPPTQSVILDSSGNLVQTSQTLLASGTSFQLTYAQVLPWDLNFGSSLKLVQMNLAGDMVRIPGLDLGVQKSFLNRKLTTGVSVLNISYGLERLDASEIRDFLPLTVRVGARYEVFRNQKNLVNVYSDLGYSLQDPMIVNFGLEYKFLEYFYLRSGVNPTSLTNQYAFGGGLSYTYLQGRYNLDYAIANNNNFGWSNMFTFRYSYLLPASTAKQPAKELIPDNVEDPKFGLASVPLSWDDVTRMISIGSEEMLRVITKSGQEYVGYPENVTPSHIIIIDGSGNRKMKIDRVNILIVLSVIKTDY